MTLKLGSNQIEVIVSKDTIYANRETFNISEVKAIYDRIDSVLNKGTSLGKYSASIDDETRFLRIGCFSDNNLFSMIELYTVIQTSKTL